MAEPVILHEPKTEQIMARIRASIVAGHYRPGLRLPTFAEMETDFSVGRAVIQRALEELKREGFVRSEGRKGLYVTENPPHLFQYGLVLPSSPGDPGWCQLMTALNNEAYRIEQADSLRRFRFYYDMKPRGAKPATQQQLQEDMQAHRLAGLIIHRESASLVDEVTEVAPKVPHVHLFADARTGVAAPCITVDAAELINRALRLLHDKGRRRVAILAMSGTHEDIKYNEVFAEAGLEYHAPWVQWIARSDPGTCEHLVSLLMDYSKKSRPDAFIVADDNLVPYVSSGLVAAGIRAGDDLDLVAHCNWPWPPRSVLPMVRIGFDLREMMRRALETIALQHTAGTPEPYQLIKPQFEWETQTPDDQR